MKLQTKIFTLLSVVLGILLVSFLLFQYIQFNERQLFFQDNKKNQEQIIDKVIQINRIKTEQLLNDNSGWDDMVSFIAKPDKNWAKDNVNFFVNSFKLSFVLVYNKDKELIYQFGDSICLKGLKYPDQALINLKLTKAPFAHYFQDCGNELIEMFGAIVVPSADADLRDTPPQGYLFIGRKWSDSYVREHADATGFNVELTTDNNPKDYKKNPSQIYYFRNLDDYNGQPIGTVIFSKTDGLQNALKQLYNLSILAILLCIVALLVFLHYFRKIILTPIYKLSKTLNTNDTEAIAPLRNNDDEFKVVANLICDFFEQQKELTANNAKLQEINATKDRLFSIIAHDLKNPVGSIVSISELLSDYLKENDLENTQKIVEMLKEQSNEALSLLTSLFDWARSQSGQMQFVPGAIWLSAVADEVVSNLKPSAQHKSITIRNEIANNLQVIADLNMLRTVIRNLVSNAIKFTNNEGSIEISAKVKDTLVEVCVADNGIGMSEETRSNLFRIESHLSVRGTANEKGNGLGLIICRELIEKQGGTIRVETKLDSGSRFIFTLPAKTSE